MFSFEVGVEEAIVPISFPDPINFRYLNKDTLFMII